MGWFASITLATGALVTAVSGMVLYLGQFAAARVMAGLPNTDLIIAHPQLALALGAVLVILGIFCQAGPA